ncbi:MAG TPA: tripartite tricarboxylate transporter substrate binding protein [Burkholderiaceae bacterium]|nr:tripartite tricarboxylate transporter substrate binding protein [Burkholderiaceae bacterium]
MQDTPPTFPVISHRSRRRLLVLGPAALTATAWQRAAQAQAWPAKPIRIIAAQAPGASNDATARSYADYFSTRLGVAVTVENKPGGLGMIAAEMVARSPADGHTLLMTLHSNLAQAPVLLKKVPLDTSRDLVPIAALSTGVGVGAMKKDLPVANLKELIELARKRPVTVGNYGIASGWHLMMLQLARQTGAKFDIVNYKGTGPMMVDLLAGQIDLGGGSLAGLGASIQRGSIRPFVITYGSRSSKLPGVPTWVDEGFTGPAFQSLAECNLLLAPTGTPPEVVNRLAQLAHESAQQSPRVKALIDQLGLDSGPIVGDELRRFIDQVWPAYRGLTRELGLAVE